MMESRLFKIGDKVERIEGGDFRVNGKAILKLGEIGTVTDVIGYSLGINGSNAEGCPDFFKKVDEFPFKVEDAVHPKPGVIGQPSRCGARIQKEWVGTIKVISLDTGNVQLSSGWWMHVSEIELDNDSKQEAGGATMSFKIGDNVRVLSGCIAGNVGDTGVVVEVSSSSFRVRWNVNNKILWENRASIELINGGVTMELKDIKKESLAEASKKFAEERNNEEIEFAKKELRAATDKVNEIDRQIKALEESKKPFLEKLATFR
jgi:hypothetical protein